MSETPRSFDEQAALARVAGDSNLLREIAEIYLESYESMLQSVRDAVAAGDADGVRSAAHRLKGGVSSFEATAATDAARRLERMGQNQDLADARATMVELETEAMRLATDLSDYCGR